MTLELDAPILEKLKRLQERDGRPLGRLVSELLARALAEGASCAFSAPRMEWVSKPMKALVDVDDKVAVQRVLDQRES